MKIVRITPQEISSDSSRESDEQLWGRFKTGDRQAFSRIYELQIDALFNYGKNFCKDEALILDSIQDLFVEIWNRKEHLGETDNIRYYLLKSLRRKLFTSHKDTQRRRFDWRHDSHDMSVIFRQKAVDHFVESESDESEFRRNQITHAIEKLPDRQKEALFYVYYEELAYEEAASIMNVNIKTVYNFVWRAIETLRKKIKK